MDCTTVAAAPVLPVGYVVNARRICRPKDDSDGIPLGGFADTGCDELDMFPCSHGTVALHC